MPHLHLSLQAGDDLTLKRMKRRHLRADAIRFCLEARRLRPDLVFGADLIAGFPTETETMFECTLRLVEECDLTYLHVFPYSPRPGTPAARMPQVARQVVKERAGRLRALADRRRNAYLDSLAGSTAEVLLESQRMGRTPQFSEVTLSHDVGAPGQSVRARINGRLGHRLEGTLAE